MNDRYKIRLAELILESVAEDFTVDEVFDLDDIKTYIKTQCDPNDVFEDSELISYVKNNFDPDDVFSDYDLEQWAESHGYVEEE